MNQSRIKPCQAGKRHKWQHVKDFTSRKVWIGPNGSRATISLRGLYKCEHCDERKRGRPA